MPITKRTITNVRWQMKSRGILGQDGLPINKDDPKTPSTSLGQERVPSLDDPQDPQDTIIREDDPKEDSNKTVLPTRARAGKNTHSETVEVLVDFYRTNGMKVQV